LLLSFTARTRGYVVETPSLGGRQRVLRILVAKMDSGFETERRDAAFGYFDL